MRTMHKRTLLLSLLLSLLLAACGSGPSTQATDEADAREQILANTKQLSVNWNKGDMAAYLAAYGQNERTSLVFGNTVVAGIDPMTELFTSTWSTEELMGDFDTDQVTVQLVAPRLAIAKGQFEHQFTDHRVIGAFSHVWRQSATGKWEIIHEHTSRGRVE